MDNYKVTELIKELQDGVRSYLNSETYTTWLTAVARFHNYSINNILLILRQNPQATQVASYRTWRSLGCQVKKGEHGIKVLVPTPVKVRREMGDMDMDEEEKMIMHFKIGHVFDISQINGELPDAGIRELQGTVPEFARFLDAAKAISPVPVRFDSHLDGEAKGYFSPYEKEIVIRAGMAEEQSAKTILHEMAHAVMHAEGEGHSADRAAKEVQAESVAYICSRALFGMDSGDYSFGYIGTWSSRDTKELMNSLKEIKDTASLLIVRFREYWGREEKVQTERDDSFFRLNASGLL